MTIPPDDDRWRFVGPPHYPEENPMKREPLVTVATITALVGAVISLLVAFGVKLTGDQQTAILAVTTVIAPLIVAAFVRPRVTPVE